MSDQSRPARGYSWPPFEKGHTLSVTHGATSERIVADRGLSLAKPYIDAILALPLIEEVDRPLVDGLARRLAQRELIESYIDGLGGSLIDARGRRRACVPLLLKLDQVIIGYCHELGIGPAARASLMSSVSAIQREREQARRAAEAQESLRQEFGDGRRS